MRDLIDQYQKCAREITRLEEKINIIYLAAGSAKIKNISGMPMAPGFSGSGLEDTFIWIEELTDRLEECKAELNKLTFMINDKLNCVGIDGIARAVFWYREIRGMKWREIAVMTGKSVRQLQRIYQKTIYNVMLL